MILGQDIISQMGKTKDPIMKEILRTKLTSIYFGVFIGCMEGVKEFKELGSWEERSKWLKKNFNCMILPEGLMELNDDYEELKKTEKGRKDLKRFARQALEYVEGIDID